MPETPFGRMEDEHLEFKRRDALGNPEIIAKEAVAMLNAEGGEIWVGLREENGIAVEAEPISQLGLERRRLQDYLVDTIEPSPTSRELEVGAENDLLKVRVSEGQRKPYAFLRKGGRHFVTRIGGRMRPMSRDEIDRAFKAQQAGEKEIENTEAALRLELDDLQQKRPAREEFWLRIRPAGRHALDLDRLAETDLLVDPKATGNRRAGSTFLAARAWGATLGRAREAGAASYLTVGKPESSELAVYGDGSLQFSVPLKSFHAGNDPGASKPLDPDALAEYPTSVFRLAARLYSQPSLWEREEPPLPDTLLVVGLAFLGLRGWSLRPGSPRIRGHFEFFHSPPREYPEDDFILEPPLHFKIREVGKDPDTCGYRLVRRIYGDAFLYSIDDIPEEFDRKTGRLILPE